MNTNKSTEISGISYQSRWHDNTALLDLMPAIKKFKRPFKILQIIKSSVKLYVATDLLHECY